MVEFPTTDAFTVRSLPTVQPPIPRGGGRIITDAGELTQIVNGNIFKFLAYIEFPLNSATRRGNHYHERKTERLYIIKGHLQATFFEIDTQVRKELELRSGDLITIVPRCAHTYTALEHTHAVEFSEEVYDPEDTIPYILG
jgi:mannose-6-phosphate isomerase-like protein (cupin superfamily)